MWLMMDQRPEQQQHNSLADRVYSSEEELGGSSDDDEEFIIPAKYIRITTISEILAHGPTDLDVSHVSEKEIRLDPVVVADHVYLGTDLMTIDNHTLLEEGSCHTLPAFIQSGIVPFPGQVLPLVLHTSPQITVIQAVIAGPIKIIALIPATVANLSATFSLSEYGTTAEISQHGPPNEAIAGYRVKVKVKQRFKVIESWTDECNNYVAKVQILPESDLPRQHPWMMHRPVNRRERLLDSAIQRNDWRHYRAFLNSPASSMTGWMFQQFDCYALAAILRHRLKQTMAIDERTMTLVPTNPLQLSYWAANNLIFDLTSRLNLLQKDNLIQRLKRSLEILEKRFIFVCLSCNRLIAKQSDVALISSQGPNTMFGIPTAGQIRKVITVGQAHNVRVVSVPSVETSWFPGYAWSPGECTQCKNHIGWFIAGVKGKCMKPENFWVLCGESLRAESSDEDDSATSPSNSNSRASNSSGDSSASTSSGDSSSSVATSNLNGSS